MLYKYDIIIADLLFWTNVTKHQKSSKMHHILHAIWKHFLFGGMMLHYTGIHREFLDWSQNLWPHILHITSDLLRYHHKVKGYFICTDADFTACTCQASYKDVTLSWHSQGYIFSTSNDLWPNLVLRSKVIKWKKALQPGLCPMHCSVYISPEYASDVAGKS